jgi:hypothetical protein
MRLYASTYGVLLGRQVALLKSAADLGRDASTVVWGELSTPTATRRALQRGYLDAARSLLDAWSQGRGAQEAADAKALAGLEVSNTAARALAESGDDALFISWLRADLARLKPRLDNQAILARDDTERLHYADMAAITFRLLQLASR